MTAVNRRARALALVLAAAVAACSDSTGPDLVNLDDVLTEVSDVEGYSTMGATLGGAPMMPSHTSAPGPCNFVAASQSFVCPPVTHGGMTMNRSYQLLDASNSPMSAFNPATTAAVKTIMDMSGAPTMPAGVTATITHHSEQTVGGLLTGTRTLTGTATSRYIVTTDAQVDTMNTTTATNLTLPTRASGSRYPSGTVTTQMSSSIRPGTGITVTTTFNGTSTATMTMTVAGVTQTCTLNLEQRTPPVCG